MASNVDGSLHGRVECGMRLARRVEGRYRRDKCDFRRPGNKCIVCPCSAERVPVETLFNYLEGGDTLQVLKSSRKTGRLAPRWICGVPLLYGGARPRPFAHFLWGFPFPRRPSRSWKKPGGCGCAALHEDSHPRVRRPATAAFVFRPRLPYSTSWILRRPPRSMC